MEKQNLEGGAALAGFWPGCLASLLQWGSANLIRSNTWWEWRKEIIKVGRSAC